MRVSLNSLPSAAKTYQVDFPKLTGGLNLSELNYRLDANESPDVRNLLWQDGVLQCRDGQSWASADAALGTGYTCFSELFHGYAVFHIGTGLYCGAPGSDLMELKSLYTGVPENRGTFFRYLDWLFYKNRGGYVRIKYDPEVGEIKAENMADLAYVPVIQINGDPETGAGDSYQPENRISAKKTVRYNAKSGVTVYQLPVKNVDDIVSVYVDGTKVEDYSAKLTDGTVTFKTAPGVTDPPTNNTVEITFSKADSDTFNSVMDCCYAATAGAENSICILLAGCEAQPNMVFWNDRDNLSMDPGYFPFPYYNLAGDTNDPVTGFGRQYSDTILLKEHSVGKLTYGVETENVDGRYSISFTYANVNDKIGCDLPWSIQLVENNLIFCNTYQGVQMLRSSSAAYENNVTCISRKVNGGPGRGLLHDVRQPGVVTAFDDDDRYWLCANGNVYLWDYALSTFSEPSWFFFTNVAGVAYFRDYDHNIYHLNAQGRVTRFERYFMDYGGPIEKLYQFPTQSFGTYDRLKDVTGVLLAVRSDTDTDIDIRYETDYETRYDRTAIRTASWRLAPRNLAQRSLAVARNAFVSRRKPGCRHVRHFSMALSNNDVGCDLAIVSAQIQYKYQGRER